jgi:hypothetical protein
LFIVIRYIYNTKMIHSSTFRQKLIIFCFAATIQLSAQPFTSVFLNDTASQLSWRYDPIRRAFALMDATGKELTDYEYIAPAPFDGQVAVVQTFDRQYCLLLKSGQKIEDSQSDFYHPAPNGMIRGENPVIYDREGHSTALIPEDRVFRDSTPSLPGGRNFMTANYDGTLPFRDGFALIRKNGLWGCVNTLGWPEVPAQYEALRPFPNGQLLLKQDGRYFFESVWTFSASGELEEIPTPVIEEKYMERFYDASHDTNTKPPFLQYGFTEGLAVATDQNRHYGFVDSMRQWVIPPVYESIRFEPAANCFIASLSGKYGLLGVDHKILLPFQYQQIYYNPTNRVFNLVGLNGYGLFNQRDSVLIPAQYEDIDGRRDPETGWFKAKRYGHWGWIDARGAAKIPFRYQAIAPFHQGLAYVLLEPADKLHRESWLSGDIGGWYVFPYPEHIYRINVKGEMVEKP